MLRLWNRLVNMSDDRLTKHIFVNDYYLSMSNFENWFTNVIEYCLYFIKMIYFMKGSLVM